MSEKGKPLGRVTEAASAEKVTEAAPVKRIRSVKAPSPRNVVQGTVTNVLKLSAVKRILHSLALGRLLRLLMMVIRTVGLRALPVVVVIVGGWLLRRARRKK